MSLAPGTTSPVDTLDHEHHEHHDLRMHQPPQRPCSPPTSPRLYNQGLAPTKAAGRRWTSYSFFHALG